MMLTENDFSNKIDHISSFSLRSRISVVFIELASPSYRVKVQQFASFYLNYLVQTFWHCINLVH